MSNVAALLPCPFCGADRPRVLEPTCERHAPYNPADRAYPIVQCRGCYAEAVGNNWDHSGVTAIDAWNRRSPLQDR